MGQGRCSLQEKVRLRQNPVAQVFMCSLRLPRKVAGPRDRLHTPVWSPTRKIPFRKWLEDEGTGLRR